MTPGQRRRARARAKGMCITCFVREIDEDRVVCQFCSDLTQDRKRWARAGTGWCLECIRFEGHRFDCKHAHPSERDEGPLLPGRRVHPSAA